MPGDFEYKSHLGGGWFCTVKSGCFTLHIRKFFVPLDKMVLIPTKKGIALTVVEWRKLQSYQGNQGRVSRTQCRHSLLLRHLLREPTGCLRVLRMLPVRNLRNILMNYELLDYYVSLWTVAFDLLKVSLLKCTTKSNGVFSRFIIDSHKQIYAR